MSDPYIDIYPVSYVDKKDYSCLYCNASLDEGSYYEQHKEFSDVKANRHSYVECSTNCGFCISYYIEVKKTKIYHLINFYYKINSNDKDYCLIEYVDGHFYNEFNKSLKIFTLEDALDICYDLVVNKTDKSLFEIANMLELERFYK